jgi:bifunctional non-homologous end joining protein LigD/DNA ligase-1
MNLFEIKNIQPMLIAEQKEPFNSKEYIFELKFDGIRCIAYLDKEYVDLRNKRNMKLGTIFPELKELHNQVNNKCILDGELIVTVNGKPNFHEVQRRSILKNKFKIKLISEKLPATFVAYDILYLGNKKITDYPLMERKKALEETIVENDRIAVSMYIDERGIDLYNIVVEQELEGVVAKHKNSKYYFDKRSKDWIKIKHLYDDDFVVCGYAFKNRDGMNTLFLGKYNEGRLIYKGNVSLGVNGSNFKKIIKHEKLDSPPFSHSIESKDKIYWIKPDLVITISYMHKTSSGALRQPVLKCLRTDKKPFDCIED